MSDSESTKMQSDDAKPSEVSSFGHQLFIIHEALNKVLGYRVQFFCCKPMKMISLSDLFLTKITLGKILSATNEMCLKANEIISNRCCYNI